MAKETDKILDRTIIRETKENKKHTNESIKLPIEETNRGQNKIIEREKGSNRNSSGKENIMRIATWNIRSINGKENELLDEFEEAKLDLLAITETKKKGENLCELNNGHILIHSGVQEHERAAAGVGCLIHRKFANNVSKWKAWTERILTIEMNENGAKWTIIVVYGPNEDERAEKKDMFWEKLSEITEECEGKSYVLGDFNSRVGKKDYTYKSVIGNHGENTRNNNGIRMLDYCQIHNLIITNTFYQHKDIHKFTRVEHSRGEKSIIDYTGCPKSGRPNEVR